MRPAGKHLHPRSAHVWLRRFHPSPADVKAQSKLLLCFGYPHPESQSGGAPACAQAQHDYLCGNYPVVREDAAQMCALQMQAEAGPTMLDTLEMLEGAIERFVTKQARGGPLMSVDTCTPPGDSHPGQRPVGAMTWHHPTPGKMANPEVIRTEWLSKCNGTDHAIADWAAFPTHAHLPMNPAARRVRRR